MSKLQILPNRKYLILEKPNDSTPPELRRIGRSKRGGGFMELAGCPYDSVAKKYNTGLDKYSREFDGMTDAQVTKILKDRKVLVDYLQRKLSTSGQTEEQFLAEYKLPLKHNSLIDTSNLDGYLRLFLACRGNKICPADETGNVGKYGSAMYKIVDSAEKQDMASKAVSMKFEVIGWLTSTLKTNREKAIAYLKYDDIIGLAQGASDDVLKQAVDKKMNDYPTLERFLTTIKEVSEDTINLTVDVRKALRKGRIKKEASGYYFEGHELGKDLRAVVRYLEQPDNVDVLEKLLNQ